MTDDYYHRYRLPTATTFSNNLFETTYGLFDPLTFVVRLDEKIQKLIEENHKHPIQWSTEELFATVTLLHETIHWWQYIGTTFGLFESLSIASQSSSARQLLQRWSEKYGARKPTTTALKQAFSNSCKDELELLINLNKNWMDIELSSTIIHHRPYLISILYSNPYFSSIGTSVLRHYVQVYASLEPVLKDNFNQLPKVSEWVNVGNEASKKRLPDFSEDKREFSTDISHLGFGAFEIMEGQARLSEIQCLSAFTYDKFDWKASLNFNLLSGLYGKVFKYFISKTELSWPNKSFDPTIGLFLLACDIALNPNEIYPLKHFDPYTLIKSTNPCLRFEMITNSISKLKSSCLDKFKYNDTTYRRVSDLICDDIGEIPPYHTFNLIISLFEKIPEARSILNGAPDTIYDFPSIPFKFYFWKHYSFMKDKAKHPAHFCWIGPCLTKILFFYRQPYIRNFPPLMSPSLNEEIMATHSFLGSKDREIKGELNDYLMSQLMNDLIRQWIAKPGKFATSYDWITPRAPQSFWTSIMKKFFENSFGFSIESVQVL